MLFPLLLLLFPSSVAGHLTNSLVAPHFLRDPEWIKFKIRETVTELVNNANMKHVAGIKWLMYDSATMIATISGIEMHGHAHGAAGVAAIWHTVVLIKGSINSTDIKSMVDSNRGVSTKSAVYILLDSGRQIWMSAVMERNILDPELGPDQYLFLFSEMQLVDLLETVTWWRVSDGGKVVEESGNTDVSLEFVMDKMNRRLKETINDGSEAGIEKLLFENCSLRSEYKDCVFVGKTAVAQELVKMFRGIEFHIVLGYKRWNMNGWMMDVSGQVRLGSDPGIAIWQRVEDKAETYCPGVVIKRFCSF